MTVGDETDPEIQVRLHHERECRRIADLIKAELPEDRAFILLTVTRGLASESFASTAYVANVRPEDSVRMLQEHIGTLSARAGVAGEPTWRTSTVMRELVHDILAGLEPEERLPNPESVWRNFSQARKGVGSPEQRAAAFRAMATAALAELEHLQRGLLGSRGRMV